MMKRLIAMMECAVLAGFMVCVSPLVSQQEAGAQWQVPTPCVPVGRGAGTGFLNGCSITNPTTTVPFPSFDETNPSYRVGAAITATFTGSVAGTTNGAFAAQAIIESSVSDFGELAGITGGLANKNANHAGSGVLGYLINWATATEPQGQAFYAVLRGTKAKSSYTYNGVRGLTIVSETGDPLGGPKFGSLVYNSDSTNAFEYGHLVASASIGGFVVGYGSAAGSANIVPTHAFGLLASDDSYLFDVTGSTGAVTAKGVITGNRAANGVPSIKSIGRLEIAGHAAETTAVTVYTPSGTSSSYLFVDTSSGWTWQNPSSQTLMSLSAAGLLTVGQGTIGGAVALSGTTSGAVTLAARAAAGTPTVTFGTSSGTPAVTASSPLAINTTTGDITCSTCLTNTPAALTKVDDTNVTLTLGGTPATALLQATSITVGWTGTLAAGRLNSNVVQGVTNDTNVTGSISAQNLTLGWTGQLGLTRGGTAASLTASNGGIVYSTSSALAILAGTATAGQILRSGSSAAPSWSTATYPATAGTAGNVLRSDGTNFLSATLAGSDVTGAALTKTDDTNVTLTLGGTPTTALLRAASITVGWTGTLAASRGGTGISSLGTGIATWLGTPSSANLAAAITDETGTGALVFGTAPTFTTSITAPLHIGGSGTTGTQLTLKSTTGVGTTDAIALVGGNNGATAFGTFTATKLDIPQTTAASSLTTGALTVGGGIGASGAVYAQQFIGVLSTNGEAFFQITNTNAGINARATISAVSDSGTAYLSPVSTARGGWTDFFSNTPNGIYYHASSASSFHQFRVTGSDTNVLLIGASQVNVQVSTASTSSTTGALISAGGIGAAGAIWAGTYVATGVVAVASLPACGAGIKGARMFVTDANATTFASTVAAGGANNVPVVCNGTNWIIGANDNIPEDQMRKYA